MTKLSKILLLVGLLGAGGAAGQAVNPLEGSARASYAGGALFRAQCATCHGADATGIASIDAPDLTRMWQARGYSDGDVFALIRDGVPGTIMPPHDFTDTETWMLVSYLRSVGISGVESLPAGDGARGARLFADQCAECHRVGRRGGVLGPDLSDLLRRSSLDAIFAAIRAPDALINPDFRTVRIETRGGTREGVLKNEDAFSVQIINREQKLQAFDKRRVSIQRPGGSLMPAYSESQLAEADILAILNYIQDAVQERQEDTQ